MDFSLILFVLVMVTGVVWALDRWWLSNERQRSAQEVLRNGGRREEAERLGKEPIYVEYARAFFPVILIVFLLRSFMVEPFRIPSGSMLPSLHIGDFILVNKFSYGIRLPVINQKIIDIGNPQRGEVIVFRFPRDESINYIKRVIGVPGDHIVYRNKQLYINGELIKRIGGEPYDVVNLEDRSDIAARYTEQLGDRRHDILITDQPDHRPVDLMVPPGKYFVMGDNRDRSNDSRYWEYVPEQNLVGKAFFIWFSWDMTATDSWFWQKIVFDRIGNVIH